MYIRELECSELVEIKKLWSICFLKEMNVEEEERKEIKKTAEATHYGCFLETGEMTSGLVAQHFTMQFDGQEAQLLGIGGVVSHPAYRQGGAARHMFETILRMERENGAVFSSLKPFSHGFYRKFGYELARVRRIYTLPVSALAPFSGPMEAKLLTPEDDYQILAPVYEAFARRYQLSIQRNEATLKRLTYSNPYAKNDFTYAIFEQGTCIAYVAFSAVMQGENRHLNVRDYAFTSPAGFQKILGFLSRMGAQYSKIEMYFPDDLPILSMIDGLYDISCKEIPDYMLRVLNTEKALSMLKRAGDYHCVIEVEDAFLPENGGKWLLTPGAWKRTNLPAHIKMSIQSFSQLLVGYLSLDEAAMKPDVCIYGEREMLRRLFPKQAVFTGVSF